MSMKFILTTALLAAWATNASAATILYTAEGDSGSASDSALADGAQNGTFSATGVSVSSNAAFGSSAFNFASQTDVLSTIEIAGTSGTSLGSAFTLAAFADPTTTTGGMQRLFSNYAGSGALGQELILDIDPDGGTNRGFRFILNGDISIAAAGSATDTGYVPGSYQHYAVTYDNGSVRLYFNGVQVGGGTAGAGAQDIGTSNLFLGEDASTPTNEGDQFVGDMDDVLVLMGTALSTAQILDISNNGAGAYASVPEPSSLLLVGIGLIGLFGSRRRQKSC